MGSEGERLRAGFGQDRYLWKACPDHFTATVPGISAAPTGRLTITAVRVAANGDIMDEGSKLSLLIAEDEAPLREGLADLFRFHGYRVYAVADGETAYQTAIREQVDLAILDVMLPVRDGFSVCQALRAADRELAILMLTARVRDEDAIEGLSLGADDYIRKPFSVHELVLRVRALLRRSACWKVQRDLFRLGDLEINPATRVGSRRREEGGASTVLKIEFTPRELQILRYLRENAFRPVSREELLKKVWGYAVTGHFDTRTVDIHIAKLRRKIEPSSKEPQLLVTVRGQGYQLVA